MFLTLVKAVTELACVVGSEVIVGGIVKSSLDGQTNKVLRACGKIASVCVAGVMGMAASNYADEMIDETAETVNKAIGGIRKAGETDGGAAKERA